MVNGKLNFLVPKKVMKEIGSVANQVKEFERIENRKKEYEEKVEKIS